MIHSDRRTHGHLLTCAVALQDAARRGDVDGVHTALCLLQTALSTHVQAERSQLPGLAPAARQVVVDGQEHLLRRVGELLFTTEDEIEGCSCMSGAIVLTRLLRRQARLEVGLGLIAESDLE